MPKSTKKRSSTNTLATTNSPATGLPAAGVFRRLAALVYDAFLLFGLLVVPLLLWTAWSHRQDAQLRNDAVVHEIAPIAPPAFMLFYSIAIVVGFYSYFWRKNGQTLGMQAWRLRLDSAAGGRPSWKQCGLRLLVGPLSLALGGMGYWWILLDRERRSWHDRASGTHVVVLPKQGKHKNYA
ncbi:MAG: RDD family protein [Thauera sp.]|jgi:uncharacterized RDD family membrane protein YckC|nr:RDD family protein [Thauera sp.]